MSDVIVNQIEYWKKSAKENLGTAEYLFVGKRYDSCLFFCHLALEKLIKGIIIAKTKTAAPYLHDLERLAMIAGLNLNEEQKAHLRTITGFNIAGRYMEVKASFYKVCTKKYTDEYLEISKILFIWLKRQYPKK